VGSSFRYLLPVQSPLSSVVEGYIDSTRSHQNCSLFSPFSCVFRAVYQITYSLCLIQTL